jgi:hypothetical protein
MTKTLIKSNITTEFNNICLKHKISHLNKKDIHKFINGLYQAEGTTGLILTKRIV